MDTIIKKVTCKDGKLAVDYETTRIDRQDTDKYRLESYDIPKQSLYEALDRLKADLLSICEFPDDWEDKVHVIGVTFSWKNDIMGATITGTVALKSSYFPLVVNTPHKREITDMEQDNLAVFSDGAICNLSALLFEVKKYIEGDRYKTQLDIFEEQQKKQDAAQKHEPVEA